MGRGRAKAKQTKVARELKYRSVNTDFSSLERELRGGESPVRDDDDDHSDDYIDPYADLAARYGDADDEDTHADYDDGSGFGDLRKSS
jgi:hypothetical protein